MTRIPARDASGSVIYLETVTLADGGQAPIHVLCDGTGTPYGPNRPLLTAPAIKSADFTPYIGSVAVAGLTILDASANTARSGGYISAGQGNAGLITVTLVKADGTTTHVEVLPPGSSYPFTVNPGVVLQQRFTVSGDKVGDTFSGVELS